MEKNADIRPGRTPDLESRLHEKQAAKQDRPSQIKALEGDPAKRLADHAASRLGSK